jgi:hypothetical protein
MAQSHKMVLPHGHPPTHQRAVNVHRSPHLRIAAQGLRKQPGGEVAHQLSLRHPEQLHGCGVRATREYMDLVRALAWSPKRAAGVSGVADSRMDKRGQAQR